MTKLTKKQRELIEESLRNIPSVLKDINKLYFTMDGIEEQLAAGSEIIMYAVQKNGSYTIDQIKVGVEDGDVQTDI